MSSKRVDIDSAIHAAEEATRAPVIPVGVRKKAAVVQVPEKMGAPIVKVDRSRHRVRLRSIDHALEGCIAGDGPEQRFRLEPNVWTTVSDDVYSMLRDKFYKPQTMMVKDWNGDLNNPISQPRRMETQEYILEFPDELE
jgi:hypothetical protein